jgi:hypothetical protein
VLLSSKTAFFKVESIVFKQTRVRRNKRRQEIVIYCKRQQTSILLAHIRPILDQVKYCSGWADLRNTQNLHLPLGSNVLKKQSVNLSLTLLNYNYFKVKLKLSIRSVKTKENHHETLPDFQIFKQICDYAFKKLKNILKCSERCVDVHVNYRVSQNSPIPNSESGRERPSGARKILRKKKFALPEEDIGSSNKYIFRVGLGDILIC